MQQHYFQSGDSCSSIIQQTVDVGLPISLVPSISLGNIQLMCCDEPRVECCNSEDCCEGLSLRITQTITYNIPIEYGVKASTGNVTSECQKNIPNTSCTQCRYR